MNIICITTLQRPELLRQTLRSIRDNALIAGHHITLVVDDRLDGIDIDDEEAMTFADTVIFHKGGASRSRNIGASSVPKYRRHELLMFSDDDVYYVKGWDEVATRTIKALGYAAGSLHSHPYNHGVQKYRIQIPELNADADVESANVLSTVNFVMRWEMWDAVGFFQEPGGAGGSEDVDWCARATDLGYGLAVTDPQYCLHAGLTNSLGKPIVGADLVMQRNEELMRTHNLKDVLFI